MNHSILHGFVLTRSLEGTYPGDPALGCWITTYNRAMFGWGRIAEGQFPLIAGEFQFNDPLPSASHDLAKAGRINSYSRIRSARECRRRVLKNPDFQRNFRPNRPWPVQGWVELKVAFEYTRQYIEAPFGRVTQPPPGLPILGSHCVPICDLSEADRSFIIANPTWSYYWGDHGWGYMPFDFFDRFMIESWAIDRQIPQLPNGDEVVCWQHEEPDAIWGRIFCLEIYDPSQDERIGWCLATIREGWLEVDDFFVKPSFRRQGFGGKLAGMLRDLAESKELPIRLWIPFPDVEPANKPALTGLLHRLGLGVQRSGVRWAPYKATAEPPRIIAFPFVRVPDKPAAGKQMNADLLSIDSLHGSVLRFDDPFSPADLEEEEEGLDS